MVTVTLKKKKTNKMPEAEVKKITITFTGDEGHQETQKTNNKRPVKSHDSTNTNDRVTQ